MRTVGAGTPIRGAVGAGASWVNPVKDKDLSVPPGSPATDDRYIVAAGGSGDWTGHDDEIAEWDGSAWQFTVPDLGTTTYVEDETEYYSWNGTAWVQESFGPHAGTHELGGADQVNALGLLPAQSQVLYVGKHGNDSYDGKSPERPFLTFAAAITAAAGQTPSASNRFTIVCLDAGIYDAYATLASYISIFAPDATIRRITLYDQCFVTVGRIVESAATGYTVQGVGSGTAYLRARYIETPGGAGAADAIVIAPTQTLHLILDVDEIVVGSVGDAILCNDGTVTGRVGRIKIANGNGIWATANTVAVDLKVEEIEITGSGTGINAGSTSGDVQVSVGRIFDGGSGTALSVPSKARIFAGVISCDTAYTVGASGELYMFVDELSGTETVAVGGIARVTKAGVSVPRVIHTTEDIEAILEAASDGDSFWLEDGTHTITGVITMTSLKNILIAGGPGAIVTRSGAEEIFAIEGCEDFCMAGFSISVPSINNMPIIYISQAGAGSYQTPTRHAYVGLHFDVTGSGDGIYGCIAAWDNFLQGTIRDCQFTGEVEEAIMITAGSGESAAGTVILNNRIKTTYAGGTAIMVGPKTGIGMTVEGNHIEGPFWEGIFVESSAIGVVVRGNVLQGTLDGYGIRTAGGCNYLTISKNIIYDPAGRGIYGTFHYSVVEGNVIYSPGNNGIELAASPEKSVFAGNVVRDGAAWGIAGDSAVDCTFTGNVLIGNASGALQITGNNENTIDGQIKNKKTDTTDATVTTWATIPIPDDETVLIEARIVAFRTNGADQAAYHKAAVVFRRGAGVATLQGAVQDVMPDVESDATWDATIDVDGGNNARIRVTGAVGKNIRWRTYHTVKAAD